MAEHIDVVIGTIADGDDEQLAAGVLAKDIYAITSAAASVDSISVAVIPSGHAEALGAGSTPTTQYAVAIIRWQDA